MINWIYLIFNQLIFQYYAFNTLLLNFDKLFKNNEINHRNKS